MPRAHHRLLDDVARLLRRSLATRFEFSLALERSRATVQQVQQTAMESRRLIVESRRLRAESRRLLPDIVRLIHARKVVDFATARAEREAWLALEKASKRLPERVASTARDR